MECILEDQIIYVMIYVSKFRDSLFLLLFLLLFLVYLREIRENLKYYKKNIILYIIYIIWN